MTKFCLLHVVISRNFCVISSFQWRLWNWRFSPTFSQRFYNFSQIQFQTRIFQNFLDCSSLIFSWVVRFSAQQSADHFSQFFRIFENTCGKIWRDSMKVNKTVYLHKNKTNFDYTWSLIISGAQEVDLQRFLRFGRSGSSSNPNAIGSTNGRKVSQNNPKLTKVRWF